MNTTVLTRLGFLIFCLERVLEAARGDAYLRGVRQHIVDEFQEPPPGQAASMLADVVRIDAETQADEVVRPYALSVVKDTETSEPRAPERRRYSVDGPPEAKNSRGSQDRRDTN